MPGEAETLPLTFSQKVRLAFGALRLGLVLIPFYSLRSLPHCALQRADDVFYSPVGKIRLVGSPKGALRLT